MCLCPFTLDCNSLGIRIILRTALWPIGISAVSILNGCRACPGFSTSTGLSVNAPGDAASHGPGDWASISTWETRKELEASGFGPAQLGRCGHVGSQPAHARSFLPLLSVSPAFQINKTKQKFFKLLSVVCISITYTIVPGTHNIC